MPTYNYRCVDCEERAAVKKGGPLTTDEMFDVIFETSHAMTPKAKELLEARRCPVCQSINTEKTLMGVEVTCYLRGQCWKDRVGCNRDMNIFKLTNEDPYAVYREKGEADDLKIRLKKSGQRNPRTQYFPPSAEKAKKQKTK